MAIVIKSPKYSFVQFTPPASGTCCDEGAFCVPVITDNDVYFMLYLDCDTYVEANDIMATPDNKLKLLVLIGTGNDNVTIGNTLINLSDAGLYFTKNRTGVNQVTLLWKQPLQNITQILSCEDCFQLAFVGVINNQDDQLLAFSNCFKMACDDCELSLIEYFNEDDYAEFNYCNVVDPVLRARIPMYFRKPQYPDDETFYTKSNGSIKILKSTTRKEYEAIVDFLSEEMHEKIKAALGHDSINIYSPKYTGGFRKNGQYNIDWGDDDTDCVAQATFKALVSPFAVRNNNCNDCAAVIIPQPCGNISGITATTEMLEGCVAVSIPGSPVLPNAYPGLAYSYVMNLLGTGPFTLSGITKPSWMTITVVDDTIVYSGTPAPEDAGTGIEVSLIVNNCSDDTADFSQTISAVPSAFAPVVTVVGPTPGFTSCYKNIYIDFDTNNLSLTYDIEILNVYSDVQSFDGYISDIDATANAFVGYTTTMIGDGSTLATRLLSTVGHGAGDGKSGTRISIIEKFNGVATGNTWNFQFVDINSLTPC